MTRYKLTRRGVLTLAALCVMALVGSLSAFTHPSPREGTPPQASLAPDAAQTPAPSLAPGAAQTPAPSLAPDAAQTPAPSLASGAAQTPAPSLASGAAPDSSAGVPSSSPEAMPSPQAAPANTNTPVNTPAPTDPPSPAAAERPTTFTKLELTLTPSAPLSQAQQTALADFIAKRPQNYQVVLEVRSSLSEDYEQLAPLLQEALLALGVDAADILVVTQTPSGGASDTVLRADLYFLRGNDK